MPPSLSLRRRRSYSVTIKFTGTVNLSDLKEFLGGRQLAIPYEALNALDVVLRQKPVDM